MNDELQFGKLLALLIKHEVKFLVCGGVAVGFCGFVRTTEDLDVLVSVRDDNVPRLAAALAEFGEGVGGELSAADLALEPGCVRVNELDCPVDIFTLMDGMTYEDANGGACETEVPEVGVIRHLSRSQLIKAKSSSWRQKDKIDIDALRRLQE